GRWPYEQGLGGLQDRTAGRRQRRNRRALSGVLADAKEKTRSLSLGERREGRLELRALCVDRDAEGRQPAVGTALAETGIRAADAEACGVRSGRGAGAVDGDAKHPGRCDPP